MSTGPKKDTASLWARSTSLASPMSAETPKNLPEGRIAANEEQVSSKTSASRATMTTSAPARANDSAMARPKPLLPPVISALRFLRFISIDRTYIRCFTDVSHPNASNPLAYRWQPIFRQSQKNARSLTPDFHQWFPLAAHTTANHQLSPHDETTLSDPNLHL